MLDQLDTFLPLNPSHLLENLPNSPFVAWSHLGIYSATSKHCITATYALTHTNRVEMSVTNTTVVHGWVNSPNGRGTMDIIWSCVATIFLCSWSVLFLNVSVKRNVRAYLSTKLSWVAFTIFFPEVLAAFAQKQWLSARQSVSDFSKLGYHEWSLPVQAVIRAPNHQLTLQLQIGIKQQPTILFNSNFGRRKSKV